MRRGWSIEADGPPDRDSRATYRQSSNARPELAAKDPENTLLARQSRLRLPAELIRDEALAASGLLDPAIGGQSVRPPQPDGRRRAGLRQHGEVGGEPGPRTVTAAACISTSSAPRPIRS